jgi:hypothetical protein
MNPTEVRFIDSAVRFGAYQSLDIFNVKLEIECSPKEFMEKHIGHDVFTKAKEVPSVFLQCLIASLVFRHG